MLPLVLALIGLSTCAVGPAIAATAAKPVASCTGSSPDPGPGRDASHALSISLHLFAGTRWSPDEVRLATLEAAGLLAQCGVAVARIEMCVIDAPRRFHDYSTPVARALLRQLSVTKPAVFFVEDTRNVPAYEAEAIGRGNAASRPELTDTIWIAYGARDLPQVLAHELVHVLADSGAHSDEADNLMHAETSPRATRLNAGQCERLRTRAAANGLLQPVRP